jgi:hypothetical protein
MCQLPRARTRAPPELKKTESCRHRPPSPTSPLSSPNSTGIEGVLEEANRPGSGGWWLWVVAMVEAAGTSRGRGIVAVLARVGEESSGGRGLGEEGGRRGCGRVSSFC